MQVSTKKGMTFATGLRAVLRQDPDVIMVGEIRDEETARMAVQSSLTGHLVFSTLHTNNAAGAVSRLLDLGIEPYLVASSLLASVAQRLIRIVCNECGVKTVLSAEAVSRLGVDRSLEGAPIVEPKGCDACAGTGYRGRKGIFEMLVVDEKIRELIVSKAKTSEIERAAVAGAMATLRKDAIRKLLEGQTTLEEVVRVTHEDVAE
jgi:general secretion pathway protein E